MNTPTQRAVVDLLTQVALQLGQGLPPGYAFVLCVADPSDNTAVSSDAPPERAAKMLLDVYGHLLRRADVIQAGLDSIATENKPKAQA